MKGIAIYEAKARFSELLAAVQSGKEVEITKHGKPVVRMVAVQDDAAALADRKKRVAEAFSQLREMRKGVCLEGDIKAIIAEGRE
ncbi:MAG: type II toxin-antitoxin system prevent-host-death family antitoxin [Rhodocyclaceae bacterium]|nr:type II toxin-antitoxin system prevent-host-death family antitoxin [Rhodocyclaceae bacterium]